MSAVVEHPRTDTRARIIATAERLFREIGYQKTTVADIAKALRMSPANVYRFFESKRAINEAVAERLIGEVEAAMAAIADRDAPASRRLRELIAAFHRMNMERYVDQVRMHEMVEAAMQESWGVVRRHVERMDALFQRIVADGMAAGEFTATDARVTARCVHAALIRYFHPALIVQCADEPTPSLDTMTDFVLAGLGCCPR